MEIVSRFIINAQIFIGSPRKNEIIKVNNSVGLRLNERTNRRIDAIHYSAIPWTKFTGLNYPGNFKFTDSTPKITFGKTFSKDKKMLMPVSIEAHHGFVDASHISKFLELFQKFMYKK